jgi:2,3-bisphosphoglycerate-dependent phosphoglycerate mutase
LTGLNKADAAVQYGDDQVLIWRRSYNVSPDPMAHDAEFSSHGDRRYSHLEDSIVRMLKTLS